MRYKIAILIAAILFGGFSTAHAQSGFWFFNGTEFETTFSGSLRVPALDCTANANGGAITADANGVFSCTDDDGGAGAGDAITVNSTVIDTTGNFLDNLFVDWTLTDGGAGGPDDITAAWNLNETLAGNPALAVDECVFFNDATGFGWICEGSTANSNEQVYQFPDVDGADTTSRIVVDNTEVTSVDGDGLTISGGILAADLGTAIVTGEITDDTILEIDFDAIDEAVDEECLTFESDAGGDFEWQSCGAGGSEWTDLGTIVHPTETGDDIALGNTTLVNSSKLSIDGDADQVQLTVQGFSTQTDSVIIVESSAGTEGFTVGAGGLITTLVGLDAIGAVDMDYGSADVTDHTFTTDSTGTAEFVIPAGSIDSTEILDDTILNADINASAAIAIIKTALVAGTNITLSTDTLNVDDAFLVNDASDVMTGTLTADGLTLGANENITLGAQTLDHDGTNFVFNDSVQMTAATLYIQEQADADAEIAGYGQIWINTATPNELWFTDDAGTDVQLGVGGATAYNSIGDPTGAGLITFADTETATYDSASDGESFFTISLNAADLVADTEALLITAVDNDDVNYIPFRIQDDQDGTPDDLFRITSTGAIVTATPTTLEPAELDRLDGLANTIVTDNTAVTSVDGTNLSISGGTLNIDDVFVSNAGDTIDGNLIIDNTATEALLIRKNADAEDVFVVDTSADRVSIGGADSNVADWRLEVSGDILADANIAGILYSNDTNAAGLSTYKARGTRASPSAVLANDSLMFNGGRGHDGANFPNNSKGAFVIFASQNWTATAQGTYITLETTDNSTTTRDERVRIDQNGEVGIGTTTPDAVLDVAGLIMTSVGFDGNGAVDLDYGSADITDHTFITDSTGTAEIVLPTGSIDSTEILDDTILEVDLKVVDTAVDEECLTFESTTGDFEWQACGSGGGDSISIDSVAVVDPDFVSTGDIDFVDTSNTVTANINANVVDFADILYTNTLVGDPALAVDECFFVATATGGGYICEGSIADASEQLYLFPDVNGADTTNRIVVDNTEVTSIDGTALTITAGVLGVTADGIGPTQIDETAGYTWTGAHDFGGATSLEIPNGVAPTVNALGECAFDTTDNQFVCYNGTDTTVFHNVISGCSLIENLAAADDNKELWMANDAATVIAVGLHCDGTCTTGADISLEDRTGNAMTHTVPTHSTGSGNTTYQSVTAANSLVAGEGLRFDVDNAVSPETDDYLICFVAQYDRQ